MMTNKEKYREFCNIEKNIPIFSKDWWLDSVCNNGYWDVALIEQGGNIIASLPYYITKNKGFVKIDMPLLTQTMGAYIKYPENQSYYKKLSFEKQLIDELLEQIPKVDDYKQRYSYEFTNWLPLYWKGYKQTTRYTYILENVEKEKVENFSLQTNSRKRRVKKAIKLGVKVNQVDDVDKLYDLVKMTFDRRKMKMPYPKDFLISLNEKLKDKNAVRINFAEYEGKEIAGSLLVSDANTVYYLLGGIHPEYKDLGAMDLIQHESILYALDQKKKFDFEGSMIEGIESYFRSYGAKQRPYFQITKTNSKLLELINLFRG